MKYFCHYPWAGLDIATSGRLKPCCKFDFESEGWPVYNIIDGIDTYLKSPELNRLKNEFLQGKRPNGCKRCWIDESAGYQSKRQLDYENWKDNLNSYDLASNELKFLTLPMGNICNLKCRICSPRYSSKWIKEHQDLFNEIQHIQDWHRDPAIWNEIIKISKNVLEIHLLGGEPFVHSDAQHLELLNSLSSTGNSKQVKIHYSTNATVFPSEEFWKIWKNFYYIDIQPSIDDMGQRFEYNRHPGNWDETEHILRQYRDTVLQLDNVKLSISTTVSAFTIFYLPEFFDYMQQEQFPRPWLGRLDEPAYYRPSVFPVEIRKTIQKKLQKSKHIDLLRISQWLDHDDSDLFSQFQHMVNLHDQYRRENFSEVFPELAEILGISRDK